MKSFSNSSIIAENKRTSSGNNYQSNIFNSDFNNNFNNNNNNQSSTNCSNNSNRPMISQMNFF